MVLRWGYVILYLKDFDYQMAEKVSGFVRYSDDMLALVENQEAATELLRFVRICMQERELSLNEKKTILVSVKNGVDFLGYHLDENGKSVPVKAEQNLQEKLESWYYVKKKYKLNVNFSSESFLSNVERHFV